MLVPGSEDMLPDQSEVRKIAVIRRNGFGDLLCAVPTMNYLKQHYPDAELTLFADTRNSALLPYLSCYDRAVIFKPGNKYVEVLTTAWKHRKDQFDLAISIKPTEMKLINFFLTALGAKYQYAASAGSWHSRWLSHPQPVLPHEVKLHQAIKCLQLVCPEMTEVPPSLRPKIHLATQPGELAHLPKRYFVTTVSNNRPHNRLPPERHARLLNTFCSRHEIPVVISCLPQDKAQADAVMAYLRCPAYLIASESLNTLLHLLGNCTLALSADGGFMHMVAAVDRPQVVLFANTLTEEWAPLSDKCTCLRSPSGLVDISDQQILAALADRLG